MQRTHCEPAVRLRQDPPSASAGGTRPMLGSTPRLRCLVMGVHHSERIAMWPLVFGLDHTRMTIYTTGCGIPTSDVRSAL